MSDIDEIIQRHVPQDAMRQGLQENVAEHRRILARLVADYSVLRDDPIPPPDAKAVAMGMLEEQIRQRAATIEVIETRIMASDAALYGKPHEPNRAERRAAAKNGSRP